MVSHIGGSKNLVAVRKNYQKLKDLHFSARDIINMVSNGGGSKNIAAVMKNYQELKKLHFSISDLVRMVPHSGGSKNLSVKKSSQDISRSCDDFNKITQWYSRKELKLNQELALVVGQG